MRDPVRRGTKGLIRDINNSRVLQIVQSRGPISRAEIAKIAGLPPPTVTAITADFLAAGLVTEREYIPGPERGPIGRRPILLSLNERAAFAVGVKLRQDGVTVAVTDLGGNPVYHENRPLDGTDSAAALIVVAEETRIALSASGTDISRVAGLGIGLPGVIDHERGVCRYSSLLHWDEVDVKRTLEDLLGIVVHVDNDVNMLTAAEMAYGAGREVADFLTVTLGRGVGLGIVVRGEIYRGAFGGAGEFGHTKTESPLRCQCGAIGCVEGVASDIAIRRHLAEAKNIDDISFGDAVALAEGGDTAALAVFGRAGRILGRSVGNLLNLFNPQLVVVTGEGTVAGPPLLDPMKQAMQAATFGPAGTDARVVVQEWGDEAWALGAAGIVVHEMLKPPIYQSRAAGALAQLLDRVPH